MLVGHLWLAQTTSVTIQKLTGHSTAIIAQLLGLFRQLVASSLDEQTSRENHMIGGEDHWYGDFGTWTHQSQL